MKDEATGEERVVRWYVRAECGDVRGPMSQKDAEFESGRLDGAVMFNERIFEPEFVTTEETELLLRDLKGMEDGKDDGIGKLSRRAIDTITLLSKKEEFEEPKLPEEVELLLRDLRSLPNQTEANALSAVRRAIDTITLLSKKEKVAFITTEEVEGCITDLRDLIAHRGRSVIMQKAIDLLILLSREKVVTGSIKGGFLDLDKLPEGVTVEIRDYDGFKYRQEGVDPERLKEDENGCHYFEVG